MNFTIEYTKYPPSLPKHLGISLNENVENITWASLNEEQTNLLKRLKENPEKDFVFKEYSVLKELAAKSSALWAQGKALNVYFFDGENDLTNVTLKVASEWSEYCNITFTATNDVNKSHIRVAFKKEGHWSYIGNAALAIPRNEPTINFELGKKDMHSLDFKRIVLHEFGHALGLIHEHQSPAAKMLWKKDYIYLIYSTNYGWSKEMVDRNLFNEFDRANLRYSELDKKSIMAYYVPKEYTENSIEFPLNYELSEMDKKYIGELYHEKQIINS